MQNIIKTIYDNSKNGRPSFNIKTEDGRTLYANEYVDLERGDSFTCDMSELKTSAKGNQYYNVIFQSCSQTTCNLLCMQAVKGKQLIPISNTKIVRILHLYLFINNFINSISQFRVPFC